MPGDEAGVVSLAPGLSGNQPELGSGFPERPSQKASTGGVRYLTPPVKCSKVHLDAELQEAGLQNARGSLPARADRTVRRIISEGSARIEQIVEIHDPLDVAAPPENEVL